MAEPRESTASASPRKHHEMPTPFRPVEVLARETALPTIGIISPSYNQGAFVGRMLESVAAQTYQPVEHIINDGLSTDGSGDILRRYAEGNPRARLRIERDRGQVDAINQGLASSSADILTWLNTDDMYSDPEALRVVAEIFAKEPSVDVVYAKGRFIGPDGQHLRDAFINRDAAALERELTHSIGVLQPAAFFRRSVFQRFGPLEEKYNLSFDYEYWIRLARRGAVFRFLDRPIVDAVLHDNSKTGGQRARQYDELLDAVKEHYGFVPLRWLRRTAECAVGGVDGIVRDGTDLSESEHALIDTRVGELQAKWNASNEAHRRLLARPDTGPGSEPIAETLNDLRSRGLVDTDRTVVTSFTNAYFQQGLNLIASLHRLGPAACPLIVVYDVDLAPEQRARLNELERVAVRSYPGEVSRFFPGYMAPKNYAYKCAAIRAAGELVRPGDRVLWIDAGVAAVRGIDEIFEIIGREGAFFVDHDGKPGWPFSNAMFTHPKAARRMNATGRELLAPHICSALVGYTKDGPAQRLIEEAYTYSQDPEIVAWPKHLDGAQGKPPPTPTNEERSTYAALAERATAGREVSAERVLEVTPYYGHRQDQSIYSILATRHGFKQFSAKRYCWSDDASSRASLANWQSGAEANLQRSLQLPQALPPSALTYQHRGLYDRLDGLSIADRSEVLVVLGNGSSLRDFDFHSLRGVDSIGMNAAYRHWDRINWYPTYYCCMDTVVILSHADEILRMIRDRKANGIRRFFLREVLAEAHPWIRRDDSVVILEDVKNSYNVLAEKTITTGSFSALFGATMGYRRIALLGIDCNYVEKLQETAPAGGIKLEMTRTPESNPNYFFNDYQRAGDLFNIPNPRPGLHNEAWVKAERLLDAQGVEVVNCNSASHLQMFPFAELESVLPGQEPAKATSAAWPSVLVVSSTRLGGMSATGAAMRSLFADCPIENLMQLHADRSARTDQEIECRSHFVDPGSEKAIAWGDACPAGDLYEAMLAWARQCSPEVIYHRAIDDPKWMTPLAIALAEALGVPLVTHIMDDWPRRLTETSHEDAARVHDRVSDLFARSSRALSICDKMSVAFADRYAMPFEAFQNTADLDEWTSVRATRSFERDAVFRIVYAGSLAEDMTLQSFCDLVEAVKALQKSGRQVELEVYGAKWWKAAFDKHAGDLPFVRYVGFVSREEYVSALRDADLLAMPINFDDQSLKYIRYSLANKSVDYMAAARPILVYGPVESATVEYASRAGWAKVVPNQGIQELQGAIASLIDSPAERRALAERAFDVATRNHESGRVRERFRSLLVEVVSEHKAEKADNGSIVVRSVPAPQPSPSTNAPAVGSPIGAEFSRDAKARIEELDFVRLAIGTSHSGDLMVDVGAHQGGSSVSFLKAGWRVLAFEPDPANRDHLQKRLGDQPGLTVDPRAVGDSVRKGVPFFASDQSTGASSLAAFTQSHREATKVDVTTLGLALEDYRVANVRLLKIDAEGFDKHVLEGFPWDRMQPSAIMCEFEDRKTLPLGYTAADMADMLAEKGYTVLVSEWHPIIRYGVQHDWRRLFRWGTRLTPEAQSWGNLIAFRFKADAEAFAELIRKSIVEGELTSRRPAPSPAPKPMAQPGAPGSPAPSPQTQILKLTPLPKAPFVRIKIPWEPRQPSAHTRDERARLLVGKLGRVYWGRAGLLAGAAMLLWTLGVALIALGQPLWLGLLIVSLAWVPVFVLIALVAITARRQAFENDDALRRGVEQGIREAANFVRSNK